MMPSRRSPSSTMSTTPCVRPASLRGAREFPDDVELGVEAHVGVRDDAIHLAEHRRADERHRRRYARAAHRFDVLDARVAEPTYAGPQQRAGDLGRAEGRLRDARDRDPLDGQPFDQRAGVVVDLVEVDLQSRRGHCAPALTFSSSSGNADRTISTRRSGDRVSASVAGMPSSHS